MIEYSEWRGNIYDIDGNLVGENILHIRASEKLEDGRFVEYQCLAWNESKQEIADIKALLTEQVRAVSSQERSTTTRP